jgi:glyoxylase-like metal-dependent hydrolase (beta-lactamase superfamily II)
MILRITRVLLLFCLLPLHPPLLAYEPEVQKVVDHVYALVGETEARTKQNHGLNNTLGFIETENGIVLVSSGTGKQAYESIMRAIRSVSEKSVTHVINIGTQDHHWMGNHYFIRQGAEVIALKRTVDTQKANMDSQLTRLEQGIGEEIKTVHPEHATRVIDADQHTLTIDGIKMKLIWPGKGHYAGDAILWLPEQKVMFTGDFVYMDRMLGIHPTSDAAAWQKSFHVIVDYHPQHIIPGHGKPTTIAGARRDTGDYLDWLISNVRAAIKDWKEMEETIDSLSDAPQFKHLIHYDSWHRRNIHQTYLQLESAG